MLDTINPLSTVSWKKLRNHFEYMKDIQMKELFKEDIKRFENFHLSFEEIVVDFSRNIITQKTLNLLLDLCREVNLEKAIEQLFSGERINVTEDRAVLHTALRNRGNIPVYVNGKDVMPQINATLFQMSDFSERIINRKWKGYTGKSITDIINIGIGGSDLGVVMVIEALFPYKKPHINIHFVSNIDGSHIFEILQKANPETTLFMIASKTFTTQETMTNAHTARRWFLEKSGSEDSIKKHFIAISTNTREVQNFGISTENQFAFWNWVGGRYSLWSAIGLPIASVLGFDLFTELLEGAYVMDIHFKKTAFGENIPIQLALISIWYNNFFGVETEAILPYHQHLHRFAAYLQQASMESNGKSTDRNGKRINYQTAPIVWGEPGTNGQHAFYQLFHQGTKLVPCDFLAAACSPYQIGDHHEKLLSNFFAQTQALMYGKSSNQVHKELLQVNKSEEEIAKLLPFKQFIGNKPSNSIFFKKLTARTLGSLIAMYEHKIFVQGVIWNIFSFDQWGVELGKQLANKILPDLVHEKSVNEYDTSTNNLINIYKKWKRIS